MNYKFQCNSCLKEMNVELRMSEYDRFKLNNYCCGKPMEPVIQGGIACFMREPFPKGYEITEHAMDEPVYCKDKAQLKDICAENHTVSRYLEDDM